MDLAEAKRFVECEKQVGGVYPHPGMVLSLVTEIERLQAVVDKLRGGIADLQRHIKARSLDRPPVFIPASFCAIVGAMHKAAEAEEK